MSKKYWIRTAFIVLSILLVLAISFLITNVKDYESLKLKEEGEALRKISLETGKNFDNWLSVREYLYCEALQEGMTPEDVNKVLSKFGEVRHSENEVDFKNKYADYYLGPLILNFSDNESPARLIGWSGSIEVNPGGPKAYCER